MAHALAKLKNFKYALLDKELQDLEPLAVKARPKDSEGILLQQLFKAYNDDFWQDGQGSLLPPPKGRFESEMSIAFKRRFVFRNVIRECVERVSGAFFGKSPNWAFNDGAPPLGSNPNNDTDPPVKKTANKHEDLEKALGAFWTRQNVGTELSKAFESRLVVGRGGLRIYIPAKYNQLAVETQAPDQDTPIEDLPSGTTGLNKPDLSKPTLKFASLEEALNAIKVEYVPPDRSKLLDDDSELFSVVKYKKRKNWDNHETANAIEFSFVDNSGDTFIGVIEENGDPTGDVTTTDLSTPLKLGGMTSFNEFKGAPYVTPGLYKNNQLLNLALTCAGFALVDNGFAEVFFMNVETENEEIDDPTAEGGKRLVPKHIKRGGGVVQNLIGISTENEDGSEIRQMPGVTFREPSALTPFRDGRELAYTACLEEVGQLYAKISGEAIASGESRIQAMTDFWLRIRKYKSEVDELGSWLMTTLLKLAAMLAGEENQFLNTVISYDSKVFIGPVSATERDQIMRMKLDGVISAETTAVLLGVEDPALERDLILTEMQGTPFEIPPAELDRKLDVALKMQGIFPVEYIYRYLGLTDDTEIIDLKTILAKETGAINFGNEGEVDPETGWQIDPVTGFPIDPATGQPVDPATFSNDQGAVGA